MRLRPSIEQDDVEIDDLDLSYIDDDPLNYFLTPAPSSQDDDVDMFDFDAGIENTKQPAPIVRSISPSKLDSGFRLPLRPPSPPKIFGSPSSVPDLDMAPTPDEVDETYLQYGPSPTRPISPFSLPFTLKDFASARAKPQREKPVRSASSTLLSPSASLGTFPRGRGTSRPGPRPLGAAGMQRRTRTWSGRVSPHAWRVPSPDVWSIEEETEEELHCEWFGGYMSDASGEERHTGGPKPIDIKAAKPKKKVRFVLPAQDIMD